MYVYYIEMEDLVANALIESISRNKEKRFVSYVELEDYGAEVVKFLNDKGEKAILTLSRENTSNMLRNYHDMFEEGIRDEELGIELKTGIAIDQLINKFRGHLAWDVLLAFIDERTVVKLGI